MKNKILLQIICCFIGFCVSSCINDKGNYVYEDASNVMPVVISGFNDTTIIIGSDLRIDPILQNVDNVDYVYTWSATTAVAAGGGLVKVILSHERVLNVPLKLAVGNYTLNLEVKNVERDIYVRRAVSLSVVATNINTGWFILKDIDGETDFDYFSLDGSFQQPDVLYNVIPPFERMKGTAIKMIYQNQRYYHLMPNESGGTTSLTNQRVYHILSSQDICTYDASMLRLFKKYEAQFYGVPEVCRPQSILFLSSSYDLFILNNGKVHSIYGMAVNAGKYDYQKISPLGAYDMHSDMISSENNNVLLFDIKSSSFCYANNYGENIVYLNDESSSVIEPIGVSPRNMPYTLVNLIQRTREFQTSSAYAIMKSKSSNDYFIASVSFGNTPANYPFTSFRPIPASCKMPLADVKACPNSGNFVYFGDGNKLCVYRDLDLDQRESVIKTFPAGETISYITHIFVNSTSYNYIVVLTNSSSGYKMYAFNLIGSGNPEIVDEPLFTYSGTGNARNVLFRRI